MPDNRPEPLDCFWRERDTAAALADGWEVFATGKDDVPYELQANCDSPRFAEDHEAWVHVREQAMTGSPLHCRALAFLLLYSPKEFADLATWAPKSMWRARTHR